MKAITRKRLRFRLKLIKKHRPVFMDDDVTYTYPKTGWADCFERDSKQKGYL